ncbi:type IV pilin N-terminal domain-containing protein [Haloarcula sp. S1AR25-5A]|uniref:Type IV pilin N-terminal domain-containing protein n=1 Tax=Haloarcula terrestris TaxID=2950533 RepID=A0AAE4JH37_9EURY|nr:type IV pilin N-terminal domain-containing protein [Haloarcula terrestris]MDS0222157.1 type IV pilin N-terminal domain-containing protein [Haloarcula terrestris]
MDIKQLIHDDDAVSPVIGVILMVAITVILAAVIASFVLGLGDQAQQATPQASFSWDYEGGSTETVTITHDGGDSIEAQELYVRGDFNYATSGDTWGNWSSSITDSSEVTAGNSIDINAGSEYDLRVIYETQEGDNSATLSQDTGPDA